MNKRDYNNSIEKIEERLESINSDYDKFKKVLEDNKLENSFAKGLLIGSPAYLVLTTISLSCLTNPSVLIPLGIMLLSFGGGALATKITNKMNKKEKIKKEVKAGMACQVLEDKKEVLENTKSLLNKDKKTLERLKYNSFIDTDCQNLDDITDNLNKSNKELNYNYDALEKTSKLDFIKKQRLGQNSKRSMLSKALWASIIISTFTTVAALNVNPLAIMALMLGSGVASFGVFYHYIDNFQKEKENLLDEYEDEIDNQQEVQDKEELIKRTSQLEFNNQRFLSGYNNFQLEDKSLTLPVIGENVELDKPLEFKRERKLK